MILLISLDNDTVTDTICNSLSLGNKKFTRLNGSESITSVYFDFSNHSYSVSINGVKVDLNDITSVFYRNGNITFQNFWQDLDEHMEKFFFSEYKSVGDFISYFLERSGTRIYGNLRVKEVNKLKVLHFANNSVLKYQEVKFFLLRKI